MMMMLAKSYYNILTMLIMIMKCISCKAKIQAYVNEVLLQNKTSSDCTVLKELEFDTIPTYHIQHLSLSDNFENGFTANHDFNTIFGFNDAISDNLRFIDVQSGCGRLKNR